MTKLINSATCTDNYDIKLTDDGFLSVEDETSMSVASMLRMHFNSNDDWILDKELGIHWLSSSNDGLMQVKNSEVQIVHAIQRKLLAFDGVARVVEVDIARGINRRLYITATVIAEDGKEIKLSKEV